MTDYAENYENINTKIHNIQGSKNYYVSSELTDLLLQYFFCTDWWHFFPTSPGICQIRLQLEGLNTSMLIRIQFHLRYWRKLSCRWPIWQNWMNIHLFFRNNIILKLCGFPFSFWLCFFFPTSLKFSPDYTELMSLTNSAMTRKIPALITLSLLSNSIGYLLILNSEK